MKKRVDRILRASRYIGYRAMTEGMLVLKQLVLPLSLFLMLISGKEVGVDVLFYLTNFEGVSR